MSVDWSDLTLLGLRVRPISAWPGLPTPGGARRASPFTAPFTATVRDLGRELRALAASDAELQLALREQDIRKDGFPMARAQTSHPGAVVAFNARAIRGAPRLLYACDRFWRWQHNLRAIALGLEALRLVERYGIGDAHQQYAGYRALPEVVSQTPEQARAVLRELAGPDAGNGLKRTDDWWFRQAAKRAQHLGDGELNAAMNAGRVLGVVT